nr:MAG: hypothetical protein [Bacteriophage sp.]
MKKAKNIATLILIGFTIYLCFRNYKLSREVNSLEQAVNEIPDTVYIKKPFKPEKKFSEEKEPDKILVYDKKKSDSFPDNSIRQNLISKQDSLVQLVLKRNKLNLSLLNKESNTYSTRSFQIDLDKYIYNWYEGQLTQKKIKRFSLNPYIYGKYRPFNNLLDMSTGIEFKTNRFNYKLGINTFYYPKFQSGIGTDLELSVQYKF